MLEPPAASPPPPYAPPPEHRRVRLELAWDGGQFSGWQSQARGERTVQDTLLSALHRHGPTLRPVAAGRTDAGVHALSMAAHVDLGPGFQVPPDRLARALNTHLPPDLRVLTGAPAPAGFHARFSCSSRRYLYRIQTGPQPHPLEAGRALWVPGLLEREAMQQAAQLLLGRHDFAAFATQEERQTVRELYGLEWRELRGYTPGLELHLHGESFLRHMVRAIVGTLLEVGRGRRDPSSVLELLGTGQRSQAGQNVAALGLYFARAEYGELQ